ncbi:hypothetical protein ACGFRB_18275 [Streptomyces sp. NPDC048718]|uniref:DUF7144 family membrane protein n=1 Tax=Streptomyces sp. NPDC048718 TaxID=3365587 RepID=UPI003715709E
MSQNTAPQAPRPPSAAHASHTSGWASGGSLFAGVLMVVTGIIDIFEGIAGISHNIVYARVGDYIYRFNTTTWGWIHLCLGGLIAITGYAILKRSAWGRIIGMTLVGLNIVVQFLFLPYQPWWALFSMAVSVFIIWALATDTSFANHDKHHG